MFNSFVYSAALTAALALGTATHAAAGSGGTIATQDGHTLTQEHFDKAVEIEEAMLGEGETFTDEDRTFLKEDLIIEFQLAPTELLAMIDEVYADVVSGEGAEAEKRDPEKAGTPSADGLGAGHRKMRETMAAFLQGAELAGDAYTAPSVNQLRAYMTNSQIISSDFNEYSSSKRVFTFCPDGHFTYYFGSVTSVKSREGVELSGTDKNTAEGVWDTYHEGGQTAVLMYSSAPAFADESMNNTGLLPVPIAQVQDDLIQIGARGSRATPDMLMRRIADVGC